MQIDKKAIQDRLRKSDFTGVFTQELGWDFPPGNLTLTVAGKQICLQAVAEKKGLVAFVCPAPAGQRLPDYAARRKIEREVAKHRHQHLIVFTDAGKTTQVWQWVKRELGKPAACREHTYDVGQPGDSLIQKLTALAVSLQEEESLTHVDVTGKVQKAFDVEKVTKKFYERFQKEHQAFLKLLKGIPDDDMQRWYVSVMLNRLMFIYFIQSKGFLGEADRDYLRTKLVESKLRGKDRYYREFLCPLFFEGFAKRPQERSAKMNDLLGAVPYLNGGLLEGFLAVDDDSLPSPSGRGAGGEGRRAAGEGRRPTAKHRILDEFRQTLNSASEDHPNAKYFIFKSIIIRNLFGVDIMEEATEICKLRLFLKLVAQVDPDPTKPNLGVEPLPDIDFNIRSGNTLVGYTTIDEIRRSQQGKLAFTAAEIARLETQAKAVADLYSVFCRLQTNGSKGESTPEELAAAKGTLRREQRRLGGELDRYLASDYGIDPDNAKQAKDFAKWRKSHQPFHWFIEFYGIMHGGGFDVIIGNPPYRELRAVTEYTVRGYTTTSTRNLYPLLLERAFAISGRGGRLGFIVPVSSISTEGYRPLQSIVFQYPGHFSSFDDRPSRLFDGLEHIQLTIHLVHNSTCVTRNHYTTECYRWSAVERDTLFATLEYELVNETFLPDSLPKVSRGVENSILSKVWADRTAIGEQLSRDGLGTVFYSRKVHNFFQVLDFVPKVYDGKGKLRAPTELKELRFDNKARSQAVLCLLNATLFRWFVNVFSDCRHINKREVEGMRLDLARAVAERGGPLQALSQRLSKRLLETAEFRQMRFSHDTLRVQCIIPKSSKPIIDEIDCILGAHYGFSQEETDFIVNYDIKYRMGQDEEDEGEE